MKSTFLIILFGIGITTLQGQAIENINASFDGEKLTVTYVLNHTEANQKFKIELYSSHDNYAQALPVTGDAGENVMPGNAKVVVWNAKEVLPSDFDGDVRIKIKAIKMAAPKLAFEPLALKTYKKGRTISMKWTGGYSADKLTIELKKNNATDLRVAEKISNSGSYEWKMPKSVKGKNYKLILINTSQSTTTVESTAFNVKPRTPFIVKILPILAVGVVVVFLSGDDVGGTPDLPDELLPEPVKPGG